jgi:hypothetical protein
MDKGFDVGDIEDDATGNDVGGSTFDIGNGCKLIVGMDVDVEAGKFEGPVAGINVVVGTDTGTGSAVAIGDIEDGVAGSAVVSTGTDSGTGTVTGCLLIVGTVVGAVPAGALDGPT